MCIFKTFWGLAQGPGGNGGPRSCARPAGNFFAPAVPPPRSSARPRAYAGRDYPRSCARWPCAAPASSTHDSPDNGWTVSVRAIPGRCRDTASSHSDRPRSGAKRRARGRAGRRRARWREVHGHLRRGTLPLSFRGRRALHPRRDRAATDATHVLWQPASARRALDHAGPVLVGVEARPPRHLDPQARACRGCTCGASPGRRRSTTTAPPRPHNICEVEAVPLHTPSVRDITSKQN